jgi:hypothetical protein
MPKALSPTGRAIQLHRYSPLKQIDKSIWNLVLDNDGADRRSRLSTTASCR